MTKILLAVSAGLLCFNVSSAKIEIGFNGGITRSKPAMSGPVNLSSGTFKKTSATASYFSFRAMATLGRYWQLGLAAEMATLKYKYPAFNGQSQIGSPNVPVYLFFNRKINLPKAYVYGGINAGLSFIGGVGEPSVEPTQSTGYQAGVQLGYTQWLVGGLGVNAEAGARYFRYKIEYGPYFGNVIDPTALWYFPISLGIRYKF